MISTMAGVMPKSTSMTGKKWSEKNYCLHHIKRESECKKGTTGSSERSGAPGIHTWQFPQVHPLCLRSLQYILNFQSKIIKPVKRLSLKWLKKGTKPRDLSFQICKKKHLYSKSKAPFLLFPLSGPHLLQWTTYQDPTKPSENAAFKQINVGQCQVCGSHFRRLHLYRW